MRSSRSWIGTRTGRSTTGSSGSTGSFAPRETIPTATCWPSRLTRSCCSICSQRASSGICLSGSATSSGPRRRARTSLTYDARTSHGSTLSFITHAAVLAALDPESSWDRFIVALESDIGDVQGGTTQEGIHLGVMSGTLDLIQRGYIGSDIRDGVLHFSPRLTERLDGLSFPIQFRGAPIRVTLADGGLTVEVHAEGFSRPIRVAVGDEVRELCAGDHHTFALK